MNTAHTTAETQERRKRKTEDVAKRAAYRKAHGLDKNEGFGGWTVKTDEETLGPGIAIGEAVLPQAAETIGEPAPEQTQEVRQKKPHVKKWLGIW